MPSTAVSAMSKLMFRGMDKLRHREAFDIGEPTATDFAGFDRARQIVLVTFKRSGEAMPSPINHGVADGKLYVRTDASTGKVKRLRNEIETGKANLEALQAQSETDSLMAKQAAAKAEGQPASPGKAERLPGPWPGRGHHRN